MSAQSRGGEAVFSYHKFPQRPSVFQPPDRLPIQILLSAGGSLAKDRQLFNLPYAVDRILGRADTWKQKTAILSPKVWAPHWNRRQFEVYLQPPAQAMLYRSDLRKEILPSLQAPTALDFEDDRFTPTRYDIVHLLGTTNKQTHALELGLNPLLVRPQALAPVLIQARTQLLIVELCGTSPARKDAFDLAEQIVRRQGPPVLVVYHSDREVRHGFLFEFVLRLVHNETLYSAAQGLADSHPEVEVNLFSGLELLEFYPFFEGTLQNLSSLLDEFAEASQQVKQRTGWSQLEPAKLSRLLHKAQLSQVESEVGTLIPDALEHVLLQSRAELEAAKVGIELHESEGVIPLSRASGKLSDSGKQLALVIQEATQAPRVLNANFRKAGGEVVQPREGLLAQTDYELLVEVGPRWSEIPSLVEGHMEFPEDCLPPEEEGYLLDVVLVAEDLSPKLQTAQIWVPRGTGSSHPVLAGVKQETPGPLALAFRTPALQGKGKRRVLRGRLNLYYRNTLLQSAALLAHLVGGPTTLKQPNRIKVDYVLTHRFQGLERLALRQVKFAEQDPESGHPVGLSLSINGNAEQPPRIVVRSLATGPGKSDLSAVVPFDDSGFKQAIESAREELENAYYLRDPNGVVVQGAGGTKTLGFDKTNGKSLEQFKLDIYKLAHLGSQLYTYLATHAQPAEGISQRDFILDLDERVREPTVIQIAQTEGARRTLPWALLYQYPLADYGKLRYCKVIDEIHQPKGLAVQPNRFSCPYEHQHDENTLCPYGFWGLKHVLEQPPSLHFNTLQEAPPPGATAGQADTAVARTSDTGLGAEGLKSIDRHMQWLNGLRGVRLLGQPAGNVDEVRQLLPRCRLVYFLCHGEYDAQAKEPFLGVGPRDNLVEHRIYSSQIVTWLRTPGQNNLREWRRLRPLVLLNGCETANLSPDRLMNFVNNFGAVGAGGVIGTEVKVHLPLALEVGQHLLERLAQGEPVGQVIREVRWQLLGKGNVLGLAYTSYALADLALL